MTVPDGIGAMCCGTPWTSKGRLRGHSAMTGYVVPALLRASGGGRLPVISDGPRWVNSPAAVEKLAAADKPKEKAVTADKPKRLPAKKPASAKKPAKSA